MNIDSRYYQHPSDIAAMKALKAIPGFQPAMKAFMSVWNEKLFRIENMACKLRLNDKQLSKYYNLLPPICQKLGIEQPDLFIEMDLQPNAYTYGDTYPFIVLTSGLLERFPDDLIETVIAHECGHIACHHTLYTTMGNLIIRGVDRFANGLVTESLAIAFAYWMRCSEFSADRAALIYDGTSDRVERMCLRFAGFDDRFGADAIIDEFMEQAKDYRDLIDNSKVNKFMEFIQFAYIDHPLNAVRALEANEWVSTDNAKRIINYVDTGDNSDLGSIEIPVPDSYRNLIGKDYKTVCEKFKSAGFTNIKAFEVENKELLKKSGSVVEIILDGKSSFGEQEWVSANALISIRYKK